MRRPVPLLALACVLACGAIVGWKVGVLGYRFVDAPREERYAVEIAVEGTGNGERARVHVALPSGVALQAVEDERFSNPGLKLAIRPLKRGRTATFSSDAAGVTGPISATYRFGLRSPRDSKLAPAPPTSDDTGATETLPASEPRIQALARELTPTAGDDLARVRGLYDFVLDELASDGSALEDVTPEATLKALETRRAGPVARVRLFVTLARSMALPARMVWAVPLSEGTVRRPLVRAEVFVDGAWIAVDPVRGRFGRDADEGFVLLRGDGPFLRGEGVSNLRVQISVARLGVNEWAARERQAREGASFFDRWSFFALPMPAQLAFRILLLVPLGALIVALFRNIVGVPTFGTFMPILIALALREAGLLPGLVVLVAVVGVGLAGRRVLDRMRLLIVPRLALLLTLVIYLMGAVALLATRGGWGDGFAIAIMPMVILTMTIERLSVTLVEEGLRSALKTVAGTVLVAAVGYLAIQSDTLQRIVFTFPELNLVVGAALLLLGRYTGYRVSELLRFRELARAPVAEAPPSPAPPASSPSGAP